MRLRRHGAHLLVAHGDDAHPHRRGVVDDGTHGVAGKDVHRIDAFMLQGLDHKLRTGHFSHPMPPFDQPCMCYRALTPARAISSSSSLLAPLTPIAPSTSLPRLIGTAPCCGMIWPSSICIRARITGLLARSVSSALGIPNAAEAYAFPRETGMVRHSAPSSRSAAMRSPRASTTEIPTLTPISWAFLFAACSMGSTSASARAMVSPPYS